MDVAALVDSLERDGVGLADTAARAGLDAPVPTCPGWDVRDLLVHITGVHRWARSYVESGRSEPWSGDDEAAFFTPAGDPVDGYRTAHRELVDTLRAADPATACWTFLRAPSPLAFWARRQAHETAIHRADVTLAGGGPVPAWDPAFAADGIDELLRGFFARRRGRLVADPPTSIAVVPDDADIRWLLRIRPDGRETTLGPGEADLTATGPANALYLLLWNRGDQSAVRLDGNLRALDLWKRLAHVTWD